MNKIVLFYLVALILFCLFSFLFIDYNISYLHLLYTGFYINHRAIVAIGYFVLVCLLFFNYGMLLKNYKTINFKMLKNLIIAIGFILLLSYPAILSYDIFNYILSAKVLFYYHENPYVIIPQEFISEPYLVFTRAVNKTALYGPIWLLISSIPFVLGFGNFVLTLFNFKIIAVLSYFLLTVLLWKLTKSMLAIMFFALNPLVILETCVSSHNDVVMMLLVLFSFYLLSQQKNIRSFGMLIASIFIKFATIFLVPIYLYIFRMQLKKKRIDWQKVYKRCGYILSVVFLLSFLREEIYPWYAIWPLTFFAASKFSKKEMLFLFFITFGLMLRYIPFMFSGNYFGLTPLYRELLTFFPLLCFGIYYIVCKILFQRKLIF